MDQKNVQREGRRADRRMRDVRQDGVGRPGIEKQEEDGEEDPHPGKWERAVEHERHERNRDEDPEARNKEIGSAVPSLDPIPRQSTGQRRNQAGSAEDYAE